jgi:uncharacterized protein YuzE
MDSVMNIWYDKEGDFLEITFKQAKGYLKEISEDIYERVNERGELLGYSILNVSRHERHTMAIPFKVRQLAVAGSD